MKLNGTHKFKASSAQVYNAILNPEILKNAIPGAQAVSYVAPNQLKADINVTAPLPGLRGLYEVYINIVNPQPNNHLELQVQRQGKVGKINASSVINLTDETDGTLLSYNTTADLEGAVAVANNPIGENFVKSGLSNFFKNLEKSL